MTYIQGRLTELETEFVNTGKFPIFKIENLATGEYAEVVHQTAREACHKLHWLEHNCSITKNGYSHQYGKILKRTYRKE